MSAWLLLFVLATAATPAVPSPPPQPPLAPAPSRPGLEGRVPVGLLLGAGTAIVPLIVGGALLIQIDSKERQEAGAEVMAAGFALAPWVAHGSRGSWRRALLYGGISTTLATAAIVMMYATDTFDLYIANRLRMPFSVLMGSAFVSSVVGVLASELPEPAAAGEARAPRLSLWVAPGPRGATAGLLVGMAL